MSKLKEELPKQLEFSNNFLNEEYQIYSKKWMELKIYQEEQMG